MFRKIDRWIGRHMSAKRWVVFWIVVAFAGIAGIVVVLPSWACMAFLPIVGIGAIMADVNDARRRRI